MLADHLYERFGRPDFVLSEHDSNDVAAGTIAVKGGPLLASATSIVVTVRGIGGHGSRPQAGKDPIVLAAEFVLVAQTIVSRQIDPQDPAVLTVGTIHGGTKNNIIPDEVTMGLTLRTYSMDVRDQIVAAIKRELNGLAEGYGIPADRMPTVTIMESTPPTLNDAALAERMRVSAAEALGKERVEQAIAVMGSEDVGLFTLDGKIPGACIGWARGRSGEAGGEPEDGRAAAEPALGAVCAGVCAGDQDRGCGDDGDGDGPAAIDRPAEARAFALMVSHTFDKGVEWMEHPALWAIRGELGRGLF
jgi:amidohydrolase